MAVIVIVVAVLVAPVMASLVLAGALGPRDGASIARANVEQSVTARVDRLGYWHEQTDAETLAAERLSGVHGSASFTPFAWSGRVAAGEAATIDVLVRSHVPAYAATTFGERSTRAGEGVGAPASSDCRLVVERADGTIIQPGFDPAWVLPGEVGCSTTLFTAPPR